MTYDLFIPYYSRLFSGRDISVANVLTTCIHKNKWVSTSKKCPLIIHSGHLARGIYDFHLFSPKILGSYFNTESLKLLLVCTCILFAYVVVSDYLREKVRSLIITHFWGTFLGCTATDFNCLSAIMLKIIALENDWGKLLLTEHTYYLAEIFCFISYDM